MDELRDRALENIAVIIQKTFRGYRSRKSISNSNSAQTSSQSSKDSSARPATAASVGRMSKLLMRSLYIDVSSKKARFYVARKSFMSRWRMPDALCAFLLSSDSNAKYCVMIFVKLHCMSVTYSGKKYEDMPHSLRTPFSLQSLRTSEIDTSQK